MQRTKKDAQPNTDYLLAICRDRPNDPDGMQYTVYFINNSPNLIPHMIYSASGFSSIDDELVQTSATSKTFTQIQPHSAIKIENDSDYGYEYINDYHFYLKLASGNKRLIFSSPKYLRGLEEVDVPVLGKRGMLL